MAKGELLLQVGQRKLHITCAGTGRPTVVLISGGGMSAAFFAPLQERIASFARVCSYDRAGLGYSDPPPHPLTFDEHARDLRDLLAAAGESGPFVLVAESFGGLVARAFARLDPQVVAGMVLVDSAEEAHVFSRLDLLLASSRRQFAAVRVLRPLGLLSPLIARSLPQSFDAGQRRRVARHVGRRQHWTAAMQETDAYLRTASERRLAGGFGGLGDLPLTVIAHGKPFRGPHAPLEDGWRAGQERLAALSSRGRLAVAHHCGHAIAQEDPDLVAAEVRSMREALVATRLATA